MEGRRGGLTCQQAIALFEVNVDHTYGKISGDRPDGLSEHSFAVVHAVIKPLRGLECFSFFLRVTPGAIQIYFSSQGSERWF
ncbi:MAG TPA: hypothetical protein VJ991_16190 [Balneolales bacterium]|nr:hypothetical protein [Balneolales bacterium]